MEDGVALWKDILVNLEKLDERVDTLGSTTPPATPTPLPKPAPTQTSTPVLPPKPNISTNNANPGTPKSASHTPIPSTSSTAPVTAPSLSLDRSNHFSSHGSSFDPVDQPPPIGTSGGHPLARHDLSPKVATSPSLSFLLLSLPNVGVD